MTKKLKNKPLFCLILCQFLILTLAAGSFLICKFNLYEDNMDLSGLNLSGDFFSDAKLTIDDTCCTAGTAASTVPRSLARGSYIVYINYAADKEGNTLSAVSDSMAYSDFQSTPVTLSPRSNTAVLRIDLNRSTEDLYLKLDYQGQGVLEVSHLSIHQTTDSAKQDMLHALALCLFLALGYFVYISDISRRQIIFGLSMIVLLASYPLFLDYLIAGHDLPFHLLRIEGIKTGLDQGVFPVKIHPVWAHDYGYATGVFYGDILLYIPAVLRLLGCPVQTAYQYFVFMVNVATTLISYFCFKKLFSSEKMGLLGSMLYTLSLYRLINVYTRAAVGEYCAMIFLPMILTGLWQIFSQTSKQKNYLRLAILPALGLTGIIQTHVITCEMAAVFILLTCLILCKKLFKPYIFFPLCITAGLTLLLSAGFLVPFVDYYFTQDFMINSQEWGARSVQNLGLFITQLFAVFQDGYGGIWSIAGGMAGETNPGMGLVLILGFFLYIYYLLTTPSEEKKSKFFRLSLLCFLYSCIALYLCTYLFPYDAIASTGGLGRALVSSIQFPWRFLSLATLFLTVCTCVSVKNVLPRLTGLTHRISAISIALLVVLSSGWYYYSFTSTGEPYRVYHTHEINSMHLYSCEYLPAGTKMNDIVENRISTSEHMTLYDYSKKGTALTCTVNGNGEDGYIDFPLIYYKGYQACITANGQALEIGAGSNNTIRVQIPSWYAGQISVYFEEPVYWKIAEIVSVLAVIGLAFYGFTCTALFQKWISRKSDSQ